MTAKPTGCSRARPIWQLTIGCVGILPGIAFRVGISIKNMESSVPTCCTHAGMQRRTCNHTSVTSCRAYARHPPHRAGSWFISRVLITSAGTDATAAKKPLAPLDSTCTARPSPPTMPLESTACLAYRTAWHECMVASAPQQGVIGGAHIEGSVIK